MALQTVLLLLTGSTLVLSLQIPWCINPGCATAIDRTTLWPMEDANFFLRCDGNWDLLKTPCMDKHLFDFQAQRCVPPGDWIPPCPEERPQCPEVVCQSPANQRVLWPVPMLTRYFWRCMPGPSGGMVATMVPCEGDTLFSWGRQRCVSSDNWVEDCEFPPDPIEGTTTTTEETPVTSEETTTEQVTTTTEQVTVTSEETTTEEVTTTTEQATTTTTEAGTTTPQPERGICPVPVCVPMDPMLFPHSDWTMYYQCIPQPNGFWVPLERSCGAGTYFNFGWQQCVLESQWEDFCL